MKGKLLYRPIEINKMFKKKKWEESRASYWATKSYKLIRKTLTIPPDEQKREIEEAGETPIYSYNQTDFLKDRVAIEVQFEEYSFVADNVRSLCQTSRLLRRRPYQCWY